MFLDLKILKTKIYLPLKPQKKYFLIHTIPEMTEEIITDIFTECEQK
jgi:hypothetical protein